MAGLFDIESHLVFYRSYHFNHTNVSIHLVCIPIILLSAITVMTMREVAGEDHPQINLGSILAWSYGLFYTLNDWELGIPTAAIITTYAYVAKNYYIHLNEFSYITKEQFVQYAWIANILAWLAQFYGHGVHEKRAPALVDNLLQALVLAPFFVSFEIAFWLGYKLPLKKTMDNKAGVLAREYKAQEKAKREAKVKST